MRTLASYATVTRILVVAAVLGSATMVPADTRSASNEREDIYDEKADARALIAKAVKQAKNDGKFVLITWGGNWCGWCHLLHETFETNAEIKAYLKQNFVRIPIDSRSNKDLMKEMKVDPPGVPYMTVLNGEGEKVADQRSGTLVVDGRHDPEKVMAFLNKYKVSPAKVTSATSAAESKLGAALSELDRGDKRLFVKFSTESCGWCRRLDSFLDGPSIQPILSKYFTFIEIDQGNLPGATELRARLSANGRRSGGVPWFAILDKDGKVLNTATGPTGNIGYPAEPEGIVHFMKMLGESANTLQDSELDIVESKLKLLAKDLGF